MGKSIPVARAGGNPREDAALISVFQTRFTGQVLGSKAPTSQEKVSSYCKVNRVTVNLPYFIALVLQIPMRTLQ